MDIKERFLAAKRALFDKAYSHLNAKQREAVFSTEGSLLVLAGAGSGKTTVLVSRISFIVKYGNAYYSEHVPYSLDEALVDSLEKAVELPREEIEKMLPMFRTEPCAPWNMLAITFTNKAAGEIKSRLSAAFGEGESATDIWAGTFHSVCMRILRRYGDRLGYDTSFTVYDTEDTKKTITSVIKELNIDSKAIPIKTVMAEISRAKDKLIGPEDYALEFATDDIRKKQISKIYAEYQKNLCCFW